MIVTNIYALELLLLVEPCEDSRRLLASGGEFLAASCPWFGPQTGHGQRCQPQLADAGGHGEPLCHILGMGTEFHGWGYPWGCTNCGPAAVCVQAALGPLDNPL